MRVLLLFLSRIERIIRNYEQKNYKDDGRGSRVEHEEEGILKED